MLGHNKKEKKKRMDLNYENSSTIYVNLAVLSHSKAEFIIDIARILPGMKRPEVQNRLIMTPIHAKLLHRALTENIRKFEDKFGKIEIPTEAEPGMGMGFKA